MLHTGNWEKWLLVCGGFFFLNFFFLDLELSGCVIATLNATFYFRQ